MNFSGGGESAVWERQLGDPTLRGGAAAGRPAGTATRPPKRRRRRGSPEHEGQRECNARSRPAPARPAPPRLGPEPPRPGRRCRRGPGKPLSMAHPALAEQVQEAALGPDIEGGAHRGPAGADPSGSDSSPEATSARWPWPQSRNSGPEAAQPSGAQHGVPAAASANPEVGAPAPCVSTAAATPRHVPHALPGRGREYVDVPEQERRPAAFFAASQVWRPRVSRMRNG